MESIERKLVREFIIAWRKNEEAVQALNDALRLFSPDNGFFDGACNELLIASENMIYHLIGEGKADHFWNMVVRGEPEGDIIKEMFNEN